jgi:hypothetical protein
VAGQDNDDSTPPKRTIGLIVFGVIWTLFSSIFVVVGLWTSWKAVTVSAWDKVPCVIERFEILDDKNQDPPFRADLVFHYEIDGRKYGGSRLWPDKKGSDKYEDLSELRESLAQGPEGPLASPAGVTAECRVNPDDPAESSLFGKGGGDLVGGLVFAVFGGFFVLIGIGLIVGGIKAPQGRAKSAGTSNEASPFVVVIALLFFGLAGLGIFGGVVVPKALEWISMRGWKETDAEVIWSRVARHSDGDGTTYSVDLFYRYRFGGKEYRSNRYNLTGGSSSGHSGKQAVVRAHPPGAALRVFVDPGQPWRAVVKRDAGWGALFVLFPLPFLAVGFGGLWWYFKKRNEGRSVSLPRGGHAVAAKARHQPAPAMAGEWIKIGGTRWAAFLFLTIFALFWNGVISFGVRDALESVAGKSVVERMLGGGLGLFMIPFVLVGIGVACGALYCFAALFAPRYEVKIGDGRLLPGKSTSIHWRRAGGHGQPRDFALLLVGREEATYSQGTSTSTAKSVFHERVLFETTVPLAMDQGRVDLAIPDDGAPTFHGEHNKIRWLLCIRATVPRLPDLNDEREITVSALEKEELP